MEGEPDCTVYEGEYRKEKRHGNGWSKYRDGSVYEGEWRADLRHGFGLMSYPDGSSYEGEWKNSLKHGYGVYLYCNGDKYEGQWYNGLRHGIGTYMHVEDDCSFHGTWNKGQRIGPAEIRNKNYRFHTNWNINKPVGVSAFTFGCDTMMTGYMDIGKTDVTDDSSVDLQWHTKEITKYDRNKLPPEPSILEFAENYLKESFHELNNTEIDECQIHQVKDSDDLKNDVDDLYSNTNIMTASVQVELDEPNQE